MITLPSAVLSKEAHPKLSPRYAHLNSHEVVRLMEEEGFYVASVKVSAPRQRDPMYAKHSIEFRRTEEIIVGGATPRILFVNSHDGSTSARALAGMYRFICANGLVIGRTMEEIRQRHAGEAAAALIQRMTSLAKNTERIFSSIDRWSSIQLSLQQRRAFATLAAQLRWNDAHRYEPEVLLAPRRAEDDKGDLWTTFNVVQENTVQGGLVGVTRTGRRSTSRPINGISADINYNSQLWELAEEFSN